MPVPVLETKLFRPAPRAEQVPRPRLDRLLEGRRTRLTLVSAPAGFGKTTLLASGLAGGGPADADRRVAWVSLDEGDRHPESFWAYVLTALDRAAPGTGAVGLTLLGTQPVETVLAGVLNELSVLPTDVDLVLDDYHLAESPEVQTGVAFLLDRLPPQVRLVIGTRADPALPLARLRARGDLTEVRAADLRFTDEETARYLDGATGLRLEPGDVAALGGRTEGWIASLQLAALSLRDRQDPAAFIAGFAGDDRYVVDYLVEEVLDRESEEVRDFLLATAVLDRLTGPLCDAVVGRPGSGRLLTALERRNLFVVPLDDQRRWYRYHHLFADVLRAHLLAERPDQVPGLHHRASVWFDEAGDPVRAVDHALAAGAPERAAELAELAMPALRRERREAVIRNWVDQLPAAEVGRRPALAMGLVGGLMSTNDFDGVERRLQDIERQLALPEHEVVVVDRTELARVPASLSMYRAALALNSGDPAGTVTHAARTLELAPPEDHLVRSAASALSALASWTVGDLEAAQRGYSVALSGLEAAGHVADVLGCAIAVGDLATTRGRLAEARATFERSLGLAARVDPSLRGTADMHVGLAEVARQRDELTAAADHLRRCEELGEEAGLAQNPYRWRVALAGLQQAAGDLAAAQGLLEDALRVYVGDYSPDVRPVASRLARVHVARGDLAAARAWVRDRAVTAAEEPSYLREHEHVTLAWVLLAEGAYDEAAGLLARLRAAAEAGGRTGTVIEVLALAALAEAGSGRRVAALATLEEAVALAEPEGWVRVFLDTPAPLTPLLAELATGRPGWAHLQRLARSGRAPAAPAAPGAAPGPAQSGLVDALSERELVVLRLLASDLDGPGIARELVVSLNTVRTHTKHIYTKLGVGSRRAAVTRAHQLGLLGPSSAAAPRPEVHQQDHHMR